MNLRISVKRFNVPFVQTACLQRWLVIRSPCTDPARKGIAFSDLLRSPSYDRQTEMHRSRKRTWGPTRVLVSFFRGNAINLALYCRQRDELTHLWLPESTIFRLDGYASFLLAGETILRQTKFAEKLLRTYTHKMSHRVVCYNGFCY